LGSFGKFFKRLFLAEHAEAAERLLDFDRLTVLQADNFFAVCKKLLATDGTDFTDLNAMSPLTAFYPCHPCGPWLKKSLWVRLARICFGGPNM
jgi:hypothetical protein